KNGIVFENTTHLRSSYEPGKIWHLKCLHFPCMHSLTRGGVGVRERQCFSVQPKLMDHNELISPKQAELKAPSDALCEVHMRANGYLVMYGSIRRTSSLFLEDSPHRWVGQRCRCP